MRARIAALVVLLAAATAGVVFGLRSVMRSLQPRENRALVPRGDLRAEVAALHIVLIHPSAAVSDEGEAIARVVTRPEHGFTVISGDDEAAGRRSVRLVPITGADAQFGDLPLEHFGRGLSAEDVAAIRSASRGTMLELRYPGAEARRVLRTANEIIASAAEATESFIWDDQSREAFSVASYRAHRLAETSRETDQFVQHGYQDDDAHRVVSLGMLRFGLPDISMVDIPPTRIDAAGTIITSTLAAWFENPVVGPNGVMTIRLPDGTSVAVELRVEEPHEGDADNRLVVITGKAGESTDRIGALLDLVRDTEEDVAFGVAHSDAIDRASEAARRELPRIRGVFAGGLAPGARLVIKARFDDGPGRAEYMWTRPTRWNGTRITATLMNEPSVVSGLHVGSEVEIDEADVFDFILDHGDGRREGGEAEALVERLHGSWR